MIHRIEKYIDSPSEINNNDHNCVGLIAQRDRLLHSYYYKSIHGLNYSLLVRRVATVDLKNNCRISPGGIRILDTCHIHRSSSLVACVSASINCEMDTNDYKHWTWRHHTKEGGYALRGGARNFVESHSK
jgi:hypothetical protein